MKMSKNVDFVIIYCCFMCVIITTITLIFYLLCSFRRLSERWFTEFPWPEAERIAQFVNSGVYTLFTSTLHAY